jgi:hypothetical protein
MENESPWVIWVICLFGCWECESCLGKSFGLPMDRGDGTMIITADATVFSNIRVSGVEGH